MWVLEDAASSWAFSSVGLATPRYRSAGVLLGDLLVCMGGDGLEDYLDSVEVVNIVTGEQAWGPTLPAKAEMGCAAYDSESGYVYYIEGDRDDDFEEGVYRIQVADLLNGQAITNSTAVAGVATPDPGTTG